MKYRLRSAAALSLVLQMAVALPVLSQTISITPKQMDALKIRLEKVRPASMEAVALLPATVVPPLNSRVAVSAPFAGTVLQVEVLAGQHVKEGMPLVTIASKDMLEAAGRLKQLEVELATAELNAARYRSLAEKQVGSEMKAQETESEAKKMRAVTEQYRRITSLGSTKINADGTYSLIAPKSGHVVETRVTPGTMLEAMAAAVLIDTSDEIWIQAQIPASLVGYISPGDKIAVAPGIEGTVISAGADLDPATRSAQLYARLPEGTDLVPGQMLTVTASRRLSKEAVNVPPQAIVYADGRPFVFVWTGGAFAAIPVSVLGRTGQIATVEGNLSPGQQVAVTGVVQLEKMMAGE
jgi:cobalt-zinc-cadmium efflux system membrane fusion protein